MKRLRLVLQSMICVLLITGVAQAQVPPQTCEPIWQQILASVSQADCQQFENDYACYGHNRLFVSFRDNVPTEQIQPFSSPGDRSRLDIMNEIRTTPLELEDGSYGVGVLRFAAVVPEDMGAYLAGTRTGDAVQFILYGDAYLQPDPSAAPPSREQDTLVLPRLPGFYFFTGVSSEPVCVDIPEGTLPEGGLLVQSPDGLQVEFTANGANIRIGSSILLQAESGQSMTVSVLEGTARVEVPGFPPVQLARLQKTSVQMGGANGLQAVGAPSAAEPVTESSFSIFSVCELAELGGLYNPCGGIPPTAIPYVAVTSVPPTEENFCTVTPQRLAVNLRSGDSVFHSIVGNLQPGQVADVLAQNARSFDVWYQVNLGGRIAWVSSSVVVTNGPCRNLPIAQAPPAPPTQPPSPPTQPPVDAIINFWVDRTDIRIGECVNIGWDVDNIRAVYYQGVGVIGHDSRYECPISTTSYQLLVELLDGTTVQRVITVTVDLVPDVTPTFTPYPLL